MVMRLRGVVAAHRTFPLAFPRVNTAFPFSPVSDLLLNPYPLPLEQI